MTGETVPCVRAARRLTPRATSCVLLLFALLTASGAGTAGPRRAQDIAKKTITVAQDGSGDFTSVQEAIASVPAMHQNTVTIVIRKGVYREKVFITTSRLTLVGEHRDSTRIVFAELRKHWNAAHAGSDWGAAVVNIDSAVTDITIANLTIHNNYGSLYASDDHQFAIRGGGTRVMLLGCTVIADGGDTVSLWNRQSGMYYHDDCRFEGGVDFVCPRGWCYITHSEFYGHSLSASIWHDGSTRKDQKFVIRDSRFDGVPGFALGRNHRDGQFFLLGCTFSERMADRAIYRPESSPSPNVWGPRYYFYDCHRDGVDYAWFGDNLADAEGSPSHTVIDATWTFAGAWDPEASIAALVPGRYWRPRSTRVTTPAGAGMQKK